jgi:hypothetical protein
MADLKFLNKLRVTGTQIKQDARTYVSRIYNRAGTLFTEASPFAQILGVMSEMSELIMFYLEDSLVEQNIYTAQQAESIYGMSRLTGHDATRGFAAFGEVSFRWKPGADFSKIAGTGLTFDGRAVLKFDSNGLKYTVQTSRDTFRVEKSNKNPFTCEIIQGEYEIQTLTGTGENLQSFNVNVRGLTDHNKVTVYVNGEVWTKHNSLYDMNANEKAFLVKTGIGGGLDIYFGNGSFGMPPANGATIEVEYIKHDGEKGNLRDGSDLTVKWETEGEDSVGELHDLNEFFDVTVTSAPKMGANRESTEFTKILTPLASKSYVLATPDNYEYFLSKYNQYSYIDAYNRTEDQYLDDDNVVYIFAMPDFKRKVTSDQDYFSLPEQEMFFTQSEYDAMYQVLQNSGQMMMASEVKFVEPQVKKYSMDVSIRYFEGFSKYEIMNDIRAAISNYMMNITRRDKLPKSDIVYILEEIEGIDSVNVRFISKAEEDALRLGYYESVITTIQPQEPVTLEDIGNGKQKYVFFQKIEESTLVNITAGDPIPDNIRGLDQWGDIIIGQDEVAVFRGGWLDRDGDTVADDVRMNEEAALSINFDSKPVPRTIYTRLQAGNRRALK